MTDKKPGVKHITQTCPVDKCENQAFVQVLVVEDEQLQKRIDMRANLKLENALRQAHKEGAHD
jgi:hypothetical protein